MLKPALIALTVMGCDCDAQLCVPVDTPVRHFATVGDCEAALADAVESESGRLYPLLKAQCERQDDTDLLVAAAPRETSGDAGRDEDRGVLGHGFAYAGRTGEYLVYRTADGVVAVRDGLGWAIDRVQGGAARALALLAR